MPKNKIDYIKRCKEKLGNEYIIKTDLNPKTILEDFDVCHTICNRTFKVNAKKITEGSKCPYCYKKGKPVSTEYFNYLSKKLYEDKFKIIKSEMRKNDRFLYIEHTECKNEFWYSLEFFKKRKLVCPKCEKRLTAESYKQIVSNTTNNEYTVIGEYKFANEPVEIIHNICGKHLFIRPNNFLNIGNRCKFCQRKKGNSYRMKTTERFKEEVFKKYGDKIKVIGEYTGCHKPILLEYNNEQVWKTPNDILSYQLSMRKSKGEEKIANFLKEKNIKFERQKQYPDLFGDHRRLKFDFFLPDFNLLIEYDGELHYKCQRIKDQVNANKKLEKNRKYDNLKNIYCKKNNIPLIRIPYWEFKNIESILLKEIPSIGS